MQKLGFFIVFLTAVCLNDVSGSTCDRFGDGFKILNSSATSCDEYYCFKISAYLNQTAFKIGGCRSELNYYKTVFNTVDDSLSCPNNDEAPIILWNRDLSHPAQYYNINLTCCDGNHCNMANTNSFNLIATFVMFMSIFLIQ